jgi:hypothetical protein
MGEWKPDVHQQLDAPDKYGGAGGQSDIYLWIVPAKVGGVWQAQFNLRGKPVTYELKLDQQFQSVSGSATVGGRAVKLQNGRLDGASIAFELTGNIDGAPVKHRFSGTVSEGVMNGTVELAGARIQGLLDWSATRSGTAAGMPGARVALTQ